MAMNSAVSVLGMMRTHSEPIFSSVVVTCGLMDMNWQPACLMASQPPYISWSHTVYSMRLFLSGSQPMNTTSSVWSRSCSHAVWAEYTSMSPITIGMMSWPAPAE